MSTTDLKPGDIVQHPEHGPGIVYVSRTYPDQLRIMHRFAHGHLSSTTDLIGWERVEVCTTPERRTLDDFQALFKQRPELVRPGHVQVRVDDLDLSHWLNKQEGDNIWGEASRVAIRAANAVAAQRAESTPPAQPDVVEIDEAKMEVAARRALAHEIKRILARLEEEL